MELLPEGQTNTSTEVTLSDQRKINKFSTLIYKKDTVVARRDALRVEKEYLDDLTMELELLDEDETVNYKVGDGFIEMRVSDALERVEGELERLGGEIDGLEEEIDGFDSELGELKVALYDKFGKNINLER
ncbi:Prefoldin subunit 4 [Candida viswanathii]|uniref:Prefoldin subunit 4 n=1 Tax=Candida viswanathii TaxID=5486 RepID=A0A367XPS0_9ASCO|nr:Prefoldin subunit 4 [Candida viswanathii]